MPVISDLPRTQAGLSHTSTTPREREFRVDLPFTPLNDLLSCWTGMIVVWLLALIASADRQGAFGKPPPTPAAASHAGPTFDKPVVAIEPFAPVSALKEYVCAFHLYAHDNTRQMQAHHYCSVINGGKLHQCVLYDNSAAGARLMGIEYLIPSDVFAGLPAEEQQLWHSHKYEVASGMLQSPGMPAAGFQPLLQGIIDMYGKTVHTWQVDVNGSLPVGAPQLMMSFIRDGQLKPQLQQTFEQRYNFTMKQAAAERANIKADPSTPLPNADYPWHSGKAWQLSYEQVPFINGTT